MYDGVVKVNPELREMAEVLKVNQNHIFVLGYAFNNDTIENSIARNIPNDIHISTISNEFCKKAS